MPSELGVAVAQALFCAVGWALLLALGLVDRRRGSILLATGPAYLLGIGVTGQLLMLLLVLGVPFTALTVVLVCGGIVAACALLTRRRRVARPETAQGAAWSRSERTVIAAAAAAATGWAVYVATQLPDLGIRLDNARGWSLKAYVIYLAKGLDPQIFLGTWHAMHPEYPILQPTLHATVYAIAGAAGAGQHLTLWLIVIAGVWTIGWVVARPGAGIAWLAPLMVIVVAPPVAANIAIGYADVPTAVFLAAGAVMVARWIEDRDTRWLVPGMLMLAAAANVKNEGLTGAVGIAVVAGIVAAASPVLRKQLPQWALGFALLALAVLPWRIWTVVHHLPDPDQPSLGTMLDPGYVAGRFDRGRIAANAVLTQAVDNWPRIVPILIALSLIALVARLNRRVTLYWLGSMGIVGATLVYAYWTSTQSLTFHLWSVDRTTSGLILVAAAGLTHLLARTPTRWKQQ